MENKKVRLLIFGASGRTGRELVEQALKLGHIVTAFVRRPECIPIYHDHLKFFIGELCDQKLLADSMQNQDVVLSALGASNPFKYDHSLVEGLANIIKAMETNRVRRLIYISFAGVKESRRKAGWLIRYVAPVLLRAEVRGHERREVLIRRSFLSWTIIRPVTLTNSEGKRIYRSGEEISSRRFPVTISRTDLAHFILMQIHDKSYVGKKPLLMD